MCLTVRIRDLFDDRISLIFGVVVISHGPSSPIILSTTDWRGISLATTTLLEDASSVVFPRTWLHSIFGNLV